MFALLSLFAKGLAIGAVFGVPIGAIGTLVVERTLSHGMAAGCNCERGLAL